jgi:hypothetical protein
LADAQELNTSYSQIYGDLGSEITGWTVTSDKRYGEEVTDADLIPVTLSGNLYGSVVTDLSEIIGKYYRVPVSPNTLLSADMVMELPTTSDSRAFDVITAFNPIGLQYGDLVDIRVNLPTGEDYVAIARKRVDGIYNGVLKLVMSEYDIAVYNSLVVDTTLFKGAIIYASRYLDGSQSGAFEFYPLSMNVLKIALKDPNISSEIDYSKIIERRTELETAMAALDENELLRDMLQAGKSIIPDKIQSGQSAWVTEKEIEEAQRREKEIYGG